jgi:hypothetical protein
MNNSSHFNQSNLLPMAAAIAKQAERMPGVHGGETGVAYARAAANQASKAASKVGDGVARALRNTTVPEPARKVQAARSALTTTKDARRVLNDARNQIATDASIVRTRLASLERPPEEKRHIVTPILNHVLGLKSGEKLDLMKQAMETNDTLTIQAVLEVPQYVSGLPPDMINHYKNHLHMQGNPEDVGHLQRLNESFDTICEIDSTMAKLVGQYDTPETRGLMAMAKAATE